MEPRVKRNLAAKVHRLLTKELASYGYTRGKPTFWSRPNKYVVEFIHLHLYSFAPTFRVHCGVRVLNSDFQAVALNGLHSDEQRPRLAIEFSATPDSLDDCVANISQYCTTTCEAWFNDFKTVESLLGAGSPLSREDREALKGALTGHPNPSLIQHARELLGVA
jgi:hypothetical protein